MEGSMHVSNEARERRKHPRILLLAYGFNHECSLRVSRAALTAQLIDISPGGARIRLTDNDGKTPLQGQTVFFDSRIKDDAMTGEIPSIIRWVQGAELGLAFESDLPLGVSDLQRRLAR